MLCRIDISQEALLNNFRAFAGLVGHQHLAPVVKSNAYGHGLEVVYAALKSADPAWYCINYIEEAVTLRSLGFKGRLLVVGPATAQAFVVARQTGAELTLGNFPLLDAWLAHGEGVKIHLKVDSGLSRQGFFPEQMSEVVTKIGRRVQDVVGMGMHFANVEDTTEHEYADEQLRRFDVAHDILKSHGLQILRHAASSAATLLLDGSRFDLCRVGIGLYGLWPSKATRLSWLHGHKTLIELRPALSWKTQVTTVKQVHAGDFVGYGCTFRAVRDMRVAVLPVGYFEGYPRLASDHSSYVLIAGKRCPLVGRICMNMMVVDVSHLPTVDVGDDVTLIGQDGEEVLAAEEVAAWAQTIHYELVTRLNPEITRHLVG